MSLMLQQGELNVIHGGANTIVCVANIIKYAWRYKDKNGLEDVMKEEVKNEQGFDRK